MNTFDLKFLVSLLIYAAVCSASSIQLPLIFQNLKGTEKNDNCPNPQLSCHNKSGSDVGTCCYDNSIFLSTQFWNYYPAIGANDTFTLHGLWPDNCDGSFEQFCDSSMNIKNVTEILVKHNQLDLLEKMKKYWLNINHNDESLWLHEFNKHGTCISSIKLKCYTKPATPQQNVIDFFNVSMNRFEQLPTFEWLKEAGISPSKEKDYTKKEIEDALISRFGALPYIKCNRYNGIQEIWYFHNTRGPLISELFVPMDSIVVGDCPATGIKFYPKGSIGGNPPPPLGPQQRGFVKPTNNPGCLIRNGGWYIGGSCATYTLEKAPFGGYNLKSRGGYCGLDVNEELVCNRLVKPMQFLLDKENNLIGINGKFEWSAANPPKKYKFARVSPGSDHGNVHFNLKFEKH